MGLGLRGRVGIMFKYLIEVWVKVLPTPKGWRAGNV
jgi:hypothetical protein